MNKIKISEKKIEAYQSQVNLGNNYMKENTRNIITVLLGTAPIYLGFYYSLREIQLALILLSVVTSIFVIVLVTKHNKKNKGLSRVTKRSADLLDKEYTTLINELERENK